MQGFNMGRYIPPDLEGTISGNKLHQRRPAGALRKDGKQVVRFEMPFAVWCHNCQPASIIAQGVRFNAEKQKVGNYYSTPIWSFRLKHAACGGSLEIKTDPKNTAYVVVEGGKARDYGSSEDDRVREGEGGVPILTPEERSRRREDAFAQLEGKVEEQQAVTNNAKRIAELHQSRERNWDDPWSANKRLRSSFRRERKLRERAEKADDALKERLGTDLDLLPANQDDAIRAGMVDFGVVAEGTGGDAAQTKPLFHTPRQISVKSKPIASRTAPRESLRKLILGNTKAAMSPF